MNCLPRTLSRYVLILLAAASPIGRPSSVAASESVGFESQIAPIFRDHCLRCHCDENREGDFSLTSDQDLRALDLIDLQQPSASELLSLVTSHDDERAEMPKEGEPLSPEQIQQLTTWITQGAMWPSDLRLVSKPKADENWWAYQPLQAVGVDRQGSIKHPIDFFVHSKLAEHGLQPGPPADRRTLIRRLTFDLHGLPPTPEAVQAFVHNPAPDAYEQLVDALLDSHHYGERYAQHWLDIAHYADTHGFERDKRRDNAWRYRDYVINALNEDKPYDRFVQEQIAGDVLWPDDPHAVTATGFLAAGPWDFVGMAETQSAELQRSARSLDLDDIATQVMTSTLAMTINCARCHDHKLDPISQREYYQLRAVFAGVKRGDRSVSDRRKREFEARLADLQQQRSQLSVAIDELAGAGWNLADIVGGGHGRGNGVYRKGIDPRSGKSATANLGKLDDVQLNRFATSENPLVDGVFIPDGQAGNAKIPISSTEVIVSGLPTTSGNAWDLIRNGPVNSQHSPELDGIDFSKGDHTLLGLHANAGITFDLAAIRQSSDRRSMLRFSAKVGYFGAIGENHADAWVFVDGRQAVSIRKLRREDGLQDISLELPATARYLTLISTDGGNGFGMDQIGFANPVLQPVPPPQRTEKERNQLAKLRSQRDQVAQELAELEKTGPPPLFYGVVAEESVPEVRLLARGNAETPIGEPLSPAAIGTLAMLNPNLGTSDTNEGDRRVALAHWITDGRNPLLGRVIANRLWQWHFGIGLVDTPSDFGFGGSQPSHPQLLDWMARELASQNWSLKAMHRLIVTSQTYRQASRLPTASGPTDEESGSKTRDRAMQIDAENRFLWRQNMRRIEAEAIRDAVLQTSGKLNLESGGPGFEDFKYEEAYAPIYTYLTADRPALWRRSIYRYKVRSTPDRFLTTLDCPDPAMLTPRRWTTTTPLQSLALRNNAFMLQQAEFFAQRIRQEVGNQVDAQIRRAFWLAFLREPSAPELRGATELVRRQSLFVLCRSLLNANEFVYVD